MEEFLRQFSKVKNSARGSLMTKIGGIGVGMGQRLKREGMYEYL